MIVMAMGRMVGSDEKSTQHLCTTRESNQRSFEPRTQAPFLTVRQFY